MAATEVLPFVLVIADYSGGRSLSKASSSSAPVLALIWQRHEQRFGLDASGVGDGACRDRAIEFLARELVRVFGRSVLCHGGSPLEICLLIQGW
jgi:hypothetical protein